MRVLDYGQYVQCKDITFKEGKYDLEKNGHPGIVLLPTTEKDEFAYCLIRTTDKKLVNKNRNAFIQYKGNSNKNSFVSLTQVIKQKNYLRDVRRIKDTEMQEEDFLEVLESFYNYQENTKDKSTEYDSIRSEIKTLIEVIKINQKLGIKEKVDKETLKNYLK